MSYDEQFMALTELVKAFDRVEQVYNEKLDNKYPFHLSLDEQVYAVKEWKDSFMEEIYRDVPSAKIGGNGTFFIFLDNAVYLSVDNSGIKILTDAFSYDETHKLEEMILDNECTEDDIFREFSTYLNKHDTAGSAFCTYSFIDVKSEFGEDIYWPILAKFLIHHLNKYLFF